ncbi:MAG: Nramp family divalent metal transporter [Actinomycetota bacterium]|nr:Nramp family divalent metal transporter [Actinomycetota bacterium]
MAEDTNRHEEGGLATEIPDKNLPGIPYADLPDPIPLKRVIGPSVLLLAAAIGSGEYVLWPFITSQTGFVLVWLMLLGIGTQYFVNVEIERYTLATGESAVVGFMRLWKGWAPAFIVMTIVPWAWPGWATGAATTVAFAFGMDAAGVTAPITVGLLIFTGIVLTVSPVVYKTVEKIQFAMVGAILVFLVIAVFTVIDSSAVAALGKGLVSFGEMPSAAVSIGGATILGAVAFAGAGGTVNLTLSNWARDKGLGMGSRLPKIVSPFTGEEQAAPGTGYFFHRGEDNVRRWDGWFAVANREQFFTFFVAGAITLVLFMLVTYSAVGVGNAGEDFGFINNVGEALGRSVGGWMSILFWGVGFAALFSTNLGVIDMVGRVTADILKVGLLRDSEFWTESKIYFTAVWIELIFGCTILLSGLDQPLTLFVIASSLNGFVMFVYSGLLIQLNSGVLPARIGTGGLRRAIMWWAVAFYGSLSAYVIYLALTDPGALA